MLSSFVIMLVGFVFYRECFDAIIKKLELSGNATLIDKMEGMRKQIQLQEDLVKRLKVRLKNLGFLFAIFCQKGSSK